MRFSERLGYVPPRQAIQVDSMDDNLRNSLWNVLQEVIWDLHVARAGLQQTSNSSLYEILKQYWRDFYKLPINDIPEYIQRTFQTIRNRFFSSEWYEVYDFIEFSSSLLGRSRERFIQECNHVLEQEMSGFRLSDTMLVPITSEEELDSIEEAQAATVGLVGANTHLKRALELLSDRRCPDYRNSIKESISAVESVAQSITGETHSSLGSVLKKLSEVSSMHPALNRGLSALYGYTSDSDGIRHALLEESELDFVDAKFMLTSCSAFVNYMLGKTA